MQKYVVKGLLLLLLSAQFAFAADIERLQRDFGSLAGELGQLQEALPAAARSGELAATIKPAPKAIVRVYVMVNAFIPKKDAQGHTMRSDKGLREGMLIPDPSKIYYKLKNLDDMIKESGISPNPFPGSATRTQKPHLTLVDFDIPIYDSRDQVLMQGDGLTKYLNATYAQPARKLIAPQLLNGAQFTFDKLDFLQDFFGARFKPDSNAQALRKQIIDLVKKNHPRTQLEFPVWEPHMSLYRLMVDPDSGRYLTDRQQLIGSLKNPSTHIEPFKIVDKGQLQVHSELLTGDKLKRAAQKFMRE